MTVAIVVYKGLIPVVGRILTIVYQQFQPLFLIGTITNIASYMIVVTHLQVILFILLNMENMIIM